MSIEIFELLVGQEAESNWWNNMWTWIWNATKVTWTWAWGLFADIWMWQFDLTNDILNWVNE